MKLRLFILLSLFILLILTGCKNSQNTVRPVPEENNQQNETKVEVVSVPSDTNQNNKDEVSENVIVGPPLPTSLEELEALPPGYTEYLYTLDEEDQVKIDELTENLPDISDNPTNEELDRYYEAILSVFQQDFIGPGDLISEMKFQSIGDPGIEDPRYQFKENLNVMVILDASGSMGKMVGNQTQMEAAKSAINSFVKELPENANVGLRIYGQEGTGHKSDKDLSCSSSELIYPISKFNEDSFDQALGKAKPAGWTPIQLALNEAQKDLSTFKGDANTNIIYLVSDGISTCDDDPVAAAKALYESDITPIVNVIGFNVDNDGQKQLKEVAKATEGSYRDVQDAQGLQNQLNEANKIAERWKQWKTSEEGWLGYYRVSNSLDIFVYHTNEKRKILDEGQRVGFTIQYLHQNKKKFSRESHDYLRDKNSNYHNWIEEEYKKLREELKVLNEMNYAEAIKALEEKYLQNTTTP